MAIEKPKSVFTNYTAFNLRADPVDGCKKASRLVFSSRNGWPRITVFYGDENKSIYAPMDLGSMLYLLEDIGRIADEPNGTKRALTCRQLNRDTNEMFEVSTIYYGKDENGIIWICLVDKQRESAKIKFLFKFSDYISLIDSSGNVIEDKGTLSQYLAKVRCRSLATLYTDSSVSVNLSVEQQQEVETASKPLTTTNDLEDFDF